MWEDELIDTIENGVDDIEYANDREELLDAEGINSAEAGFLEGYFGSI